MILLWGLRLLLDISFAGFCFWRARECGRGSFEGVLFSALFALLLFSPFGCEWVVELGFWLFRLHLFNHFGG